MNVSELSDRMRAAINKCHGFRTQVFLLELGELKKALASNPFPEAENEPKTLHIFFLASIPKNPDLEMLESLKRDSERFNLQGKVFYLHAPEGIGRSKLAGRAEKSLGVAVTARNWRSASKIMAMAKECG